MEVPKNSDRAPAWEGPICERFSLVTPQTKILALLVILLVVCFARPLYQLFRFAARSELFSYILLIPFISLYLAWLKKDRLILTYKPARWTALLWAGLGLMVLLTCFLSIRFGLALLGSDSFACLTLSFLLFLFAACGFCLGDENLRTLAFPLVFLMFIIPLPGVLVNGIEAFLQQSSAVASQPLFVLTGVPVFRQGLVLQLPGMRLEVAPECSGIHSTLVLFITSLVASQLFLRATSKRVLLVLVVIPLGILRNAIRICTIGNLCIRVGPEMIDAPIHRRGGPLFFLISLVPLFLLLYILRKSESNVPPRPLPQPPS